MEVSLLLRLLIAHLLTDFVFQPKSWVTDRELKQGKSVKLYLHVLVTTAVAYLLSGRYDNWMIPTVIMITHLGIDYIKSKAGKDSFRYFILDQLAHLAVIVLLWLAIENNWSAWTGLIDQLLKNDTFWLIAAGYIFVSWPLGIIIGKATQKWRDQISREKNKEASLLLIRQSEAKEQPEETRSSAAAIKEAAEDLVKAEAASGTDTLLTPAMNTEEQELGLANAGKWIGICERMLILTFVLMGQYTAIGFLMTAKSILRFSEKEVNTQLKTEYILVGTLVSFATAALTGVLLNLLS